MSASPPDQSTEMEPIDIIELAAEDPGERPPRKDEPKAHDESKASQTTLDEKAAALDIIDHLLFHKAIIDERDGGERIEEYLDIVRQSEKGEHVSIQDPFNKSIALCFELVLAEHMNPWKIDLGQFSRLYVKRAREEEIDLVTAGRIILMAWTVLKLQSDAMVELAEELARRYDEPEPEMLDWDDIGDWDYDDEAYEYTRRIKLAPLAPLDEKVRRTGAQRKVTLMELVDAFEEVRREVEERRELVAQREEMKQKLRAQADTDVNDMVHKEDPEAEKARIWERIRAHGQAGPITLNRLHDGDLDGLVVAFNSILFLAADNKVEIWQEEFPYGDIFVKHADGKPPITLEEHANLDPAATDGAPGEATTEAAA